MSGIQQLLLGGSPAGYQIERSLRFNSADSAFLSRTPASASNRKTWTWSNWVKRGALNGARQQIFATDGTTDSTYFGMSFWTDDTILVGIANSAVLQTTQVFRDPSAWYHIVLSVDTTQATASNRVKLFINGQQVTAFTTAAYPAQNTDLGWNTTQNHRIGQNQSNYYLDGYLTEINCIDGQALTPSDFGETDSATGVWKPKKYTGTYGTNGFYLNFSDNSNTTAATLGKDYSGNGNNWTPNNFSVTAGAGNDSLVDTPTSYGTDTGVGGEVRGNYCTLNPLDSATSASNPTNGNLDWSSAATNANYFPSRGTLGMSSGKWYWEVTCGTSSGGFQIGIAGQAVNFANNAGQQLYNCSDGYAYLSSAVKGNNGSTSSYGATYTTNDVIGIALDMDAGTLVFYKNGVSQGTAYSSLSGTFFAAISDNSGSNNSAATFNFGQRPFAYTAPSGFKALCTQNLPTPTIGATSTTTANKYFDATLYTGNGSTQTVNNSSGFYPDFNWIKSRNNIGSHVLVNSVVGGTKQLFSNLTDAEQTNTSITNGISGSGIALGNNSSGTGSTNQNTYTYVLWQWQAGAGSSSSNTSGSITSTVSANTTAGFSIVTWTGGTSGGATIGHGLGVTPAMIILRQRDGATQWWVWHQSLSNTAQSFIQLNNTNAAGANTSAWNNTAPTSTVFSQLNGYILSAGGLGIAYCFAAVAGYSAFGSYTGNGSTDGPFIYTGFRPRWIMVKRSDSTGNWQILDTARSTFNVSNANLYANLSNAEVNGGNEDMDILSNGWKPRNASASFNVNGATYIYAAFAESPFKYSLAR